MTWLFVFCFFSFLSVSALVVGGGIVSVILLFRSISLAVELKVVIW